MKRILSVAIAFSLLLLMFTPVYAIDNSGGNGTSEAVVNQDTTAFSVTLPTSLPVSVDSNGKVVTAVNAEIINNSFGPVEVKDIEVRPQNGWSLRSWGTDFSKEKVGIKEFSLQLNNSDVGTDGSLSLSNFDTIVGGGSLGLSYDAEVAVQKNAINNLDVAEIIFTVGWDKDYAPEEPEEGQLIWDRYAIEELVDVRGSDANVGGLFFDYYMSYPGYLDLKSDRDYLVTIDYRYESIPDTVTKKSSSYWQNGSPIIDGFTHYVDGYDGLRVNSISGRADEEALWLLAGPQLNIVEDVLPDVFDIDIYSIVEEILYDLGLDHIEDVTDVEGFRSRLIMHPDIQGHSEKESIEALFYFLEGDISIEEVQEAIPELSSDNVMLYVYDSMRENAEELIYGGKSWMIVIDEISAVQDKGIDNIKIEELVHAGTVSSQSNDYPEDGIQDGYWYILR